MDAKHAPRPDKHSPPPSWRREYLELWISLARRDWGSLVLIPADREGSTAEVANALADIGQRLSYEPVTAIAVTTLEYGSALALADLQQHLDRERRSPRTGRVIPAPPDAEPSPAAAQDGADSGTPPPGAAAPAEAEGARSPPGASSTQALAVLPTARLIISVPPVVTEPLGLTAAQNADGVVLAVRMNRSRLADVRRTLELVGRERVFGCFILR